MKIVSGIIQTLIVLGGAYLILVALVAVSQSRLLFFPTSRILATPADIGLAYDSVTLRGGDGVTLAGWYIRASTPRGVLLFFHGNAGNISHRLDSIRIFNRLNLDILIFDYRGYGQSEGIISESGTYDDAEAAWRYLIEDRGVPPEKIVLFGRSLGGAVAVHLATRVQPGALIIESTFTSVPDLASQLYPYLPVRWLSRFHYPSEARLRDVSCPLLVIHSADDEIIAIEHARRLFAAGNEPKQLLTLRGSHNEGFLISGSSYIDGLKRFLDGV